MIYLFLKHHGQAKSKKGTGIFCKVASASKDLWEEKTNSTPTKTAPKDLEVSRCLEFQGFFVAISRKWIHSVLVGQGRKEKNILLMFQKSGEKTLLICRIRNCLQGFYTSQVVIAGFLPSTKQWEKLSQNLSEWHISFLQLIRKTRWRPDVFFFGGKNIINQSS